MKQNLIRAKDNNDLFYDTVDKKYRFRKYCSECGNYAGCQCFDTRRKAELFIEEDISWVCSNVCELLASNYDNEEIGGIMKEMNTERTLLIKSKLKKYMVYITNFFTIWRLKWYIYKYLGYISEADASEVIDQIDLDYDYSAYGESC